jgi:hypothetical protein
MRLDAIYDHGSVIFKEPVRLKSQRIEIQIIIPDEAVIEGSDSQTKPGQVSVATSSSAIRQQLDALLGKYAHQRPGVTLSQDKAVWREHLQTKYGQ